MTEDSTQTTATPTVEDRLTALEKKFEDAVNSIESSFHDRLTSAENYVSEHANAITDLFNLFNSLKGK